MLGVEGGRGNLACGGWGGGGLGGMTRDRIMNLFTGCWKIGKLEDDSKFKKIV